MTFMNGKECFPGILILVLKNEIKPLSENDIGSTILFSVKPGFMHSNSHDDWIVFYAVSVIDEVNIRIWDSVAWDDGTMIDLQKIM